MSEYLVGSSLQPFYLFIFLNLVSKVVVLYIAYRILSSKNKTMGDYPVPWIYYIVDG